MVKSDGLASLSDRSQISAFFGGDMPTKDIFLVATHVASQRTKDETEKWLDQSFTSLRKSVKTSYFLDGKICLAYQICKAREWTVQLPEHQSDEFRKYIREIELCIDAVAQTCCVEELSEYNLEREQAPRKVRLAFGRPWSDNASFKDGLEDHVSKTWPCLFMRKLKNSVLDALAIPMRKLEEHATKKEEEMSRALKKQQDLNEMLAQNKWVLQAQKAADQAIAEVLQRLKLFCQVFEEGPDDWFDKGKLRDFWAQLADMMQDSAFEVACMNCNFNKSSGAHKRGRQTLHFDTVTDAEPFVAKCVSWACEITYKSLAKGLDDVIRDAAFVLRKEGLPVVNWPEAPETRCTSMPTTALRKVNPGERAAPVAAAVGALGLSAAVGAAPAALATFLAVPALIGAAVYTSENYGERFVTDALNGLRRRLEGHEFIEIDSGIIRRLAEEEVRRVANDMTTRTIAQLDDARGALGREMKERVAEASAEYKRSADAAKRANDAKELLLSD